jgi:hypothetical protein
VQRQAIGMESRGSIPGMFQIGFRTHSSPSLTHPYGARRPEDEVYCLSSSTVKVKSSEATTSLPSVLILPNYLGARQALRHYTQLLKCSPCTQGDERQISKLYKRRHLL